MPHFACPFCENMVPANADTCPYCHLSVALAAAEHRASDSEIVTAEIVSRGPKLAPSPPRYSTSATQPAAQPQSFLARQTGKIALRFVAKIIFLLWIVPLIGLYTVYHEWTVMLPASKVPPQRMSYRELFRKGVADGTHIVLTDFELQSDQVVTNLLGSKEQWSSAFVPVIAIRTKNRSAPIRMLVHTSEANTPAELQALQDSKQIEGTIFLTTESVRFRDEVSLSTKFKERQYNAETCYLLEHAMVPQSTAKTYEEIGLGVVMIVAGVPIYWLTWLAWKHRRSLARVTN